MAAYRTKRVLVDAEQWFPGREVAGVRLEPVVQGAVEWPGEPHAVCDTPEGPVEVHPGDWIVTGANQDRYPWRPHRFDSLYEPGEAFER